jgi:hypothetical protein
MVDESGQQLVLRAIQALPDEQQLAAMMWLVSAIGERDPSSAEAAIPDVKVDVPPVTNAAITPREAEVLYMTSQGVSLDDIATQLFISPATVRNHLRNIVGKMGTGLGTPWTSPTGFVAPNELTMLPVRLPTSQYRALKAWCAANKFSMATVVRGLVEKFLADQQNRPA